MGASLMAAALASQVAPASAPSAIELAHRYWRAVNWDRQAGNRACSLTGIPPYDDLRSPFRRNELRLDAIAKIIHSKDKDAMWRGRAGLTIAPPTSLCDDPQGARDALERYERSVGELEALTNRSVMER